MTAAGRYDPALQPDRIAGRGQAVAINPCLTVKQPHHIGHRIQMLRIIAENLRHGSVSGGRQPLLPLRQRTVIRGLAVPGDDQIDHPAIAMDTVGLQIRLQIGVIDLC